MDTAALIVTIIGALNWGLISLFRFELVARDHRPGAHIVGFRQQNIGRQKCVHGNSSLS